MEYLKIHNWEKWQSYRKDRGRPPWIKLHREVLRQPEWVLLTDAQRGQLVVIWLLAADRDGVIPASPQLLQKIGVMDERPNIELFIEQGFIERGNQSVADRQPVDNQLTTSPPDHDAPEAEAEAEAEKKDRKTIRGNKCPYQKIVDLYHETLPDLPRVEKLTPTRKSYIRNLWLQDLKQLDNWENFFTYVGQSQFLTGKTQPVNGHRPFVANLEWITKPANFVKIKEENYHGRL